MRSREKNVDIIIIGGGLVGGTLAQALAKTGLKVAVIDENDPEELLKTRKDGRSYAISLGSKRILDSVGLWKTLKKDAYPIETIKIGTADDDTPLVYHYTEVSDEPLGFLVNATLLRRTILKESLANKSLQWLAKTKVKDFECTPQGVHVETEDGEQLKARLLLACDGGMSQTRSKMHIPLTEWDYDQLALVFNVNHTDPHNNTAYEIFTAEGPFAILPYPDKHSGCVWSLRKDYAEDFLALSQREQNQTLNDFFGKLVGTLTLSSPVKAFPLRVKQPHTPISTRFALVGDAAHLMHPVAGQGLNLGFRDVDVLTKEITKAHNLGLDIGSSTLLQSYKRQRRVDNFSLLGITDLSARGFLTKQPLLRWAFSKGFSALNHIPFVKGHMMRQAMGIK